MIQSNLFARDEPKHRIRRYRTTDPESSKLAAEDIERRGVPDTQCDRILELVVKHPNCTTQELSAVTGIEVHILGRRLPDLRARLKITNPPMPGGGFLRRCSVMGRKALTWRAVN